MPASLRRATSPTAASPPTSAPAPSAAFSQPKPALAHAEQLDRGDDEEHVEQSAHHRLRVEEQHDQAGVGLLRKRADTAE